MPIEAQVKQQIVMRIFYPQILFEIVDNPATTSGIFPQLLGFFVDLEESPQFEGCVVDLSL
jgi:hypothetical protein